MYDKNETALKTFSFVEEIKAPKFTHAQAWKAYEYAIVVGFEAALAAEPGLTCAEWERRNPFEAPNVPKLLK